VGFGAGFLWDLDMGGCGWVGFGGVGCYVDGVGVGGGFGVLYDVVWGVFIWIDWGDLVGLFVCGFGFCVCGFFGFIRYFVYALFVWVLLRCDWVVGWCSLWGLLYGVSGL